MDQFIANNFYEKIVNLGLYTNVRNLKNYLKFFFGELPLNGKRMLDIGGGNGLLSFWVVANGGEAICLEPESDGSFLGMQKNFSKIRKTLKLSEQKATLKDKTFQDFSSNEKFDIICLSNSINHLNESATLHLANDPVSANEYISYFEKMAIMLRSEGRLIITDCTK